MCITDWTLFMTVCFYVTAFDFLLYNHLYITVAEGGNVMAYSIGIDLGGTNIVVGIVDDSRKIVDRKRVKTRRLGRPNPWSTRWRTLSIHY